MSRLLCPSILLGMSLLPGCSGTSQTKDTSPAESDCGISDPGSATNTVDLFGDSSAWDFPEDGDGVEIQWMVRGSDTWSFGLDAFVVEHQLEYLPSTTCHLDGTSFVCDHVVWGSGHPFDISGSFSSDFLTIEADVLLSYHSDTGLLGYDEFDMSGVRVCP